MYTGVELIKKQCWLTCSVSWFSHRDTYVYSWDSFPIGTISGHRVDFPELCLRSCWTIYIASITVYMFKPTSVFKPPWTRPSFLVTRSFLSKSQSRFLFLKPVHVYRCSYFPLWDIPDLLFSYLSLRSLSMIIASTSMPLDKILAHSFLWLRHIIVGIGNGFLSHASSLGLLGASLSAECKPCCSDRCGACVVPESQLSPRRGLEWKGPVMRHLSFQLFRQSLYCPLSWLLTATQSPRSVAALSVLQALSHCYSCTPRCPACFFVFSPSTFYFTVENSQLASMQESKSWLQIQRSKN